MSHTEKFRIALEGPVVRRATLMAIVVGTILVMINHGMCVMSGKFGITCLFQCLLTFMVPYAVSTISSVLALSENRKKVSTTD